MASLDEDGRVALRERCRRLLPAGTIAVTATAWAVTGRAAAAGLPAEAADAAGARA